MDNLVILNKLRNSKILPRDASVDFSAPTLKLEEYKLERIGLMK